MTTTLSAPVEFVATASSTKNTVLDDLSKAISTYAETYLTIEIFSVGTVNGGDKINEGDEVAFHVRVTNSGPVEMRDAALVIAAGSGATGVKTHDDTSFQDSLTTDTIDKIPAHQAAGEFTELPTDYHFKAGGPSKEIDLVKVSMGPWNASLDHILVDHSKAEEKAVEVYSHKVIDS